MTKSAKAKTRKPASVAGFFLHKIRNFYINLPAFTA
jgi:hypothetical protein